jgi:hypothetical protein
MPIRIQHDKAGFTWVSVGLGSSARGCAQIAMSPERHNAGKGFAREALRVWKAADESR